MSNKFLTKQTAGLDDGTADLFVGSIRINNIDVSKNVKTDPIGQLEASNLAISEITNLQSELDARLLHTVATFKTQPFPPTTPPASDFKLYAKADKKLYTLDSDGLETQIASSGANPFDQSLNTTDSVEFAIVRDNEHSLTLGLNVSQLLASTQLGGCSVAPTRGTGATIVGFDAAKNVGQSNTIMGNACLPDSVASGNENVVIGSRIGASGAIGNGNTVVGDFSLFLGAGNDNVAIGRFIGDVAPLGNNILAINAGGTQIAPVGDNKIILKGGTTTLTADSTGAYINGNTNPVLSGNQNVNTTDSPTFNRLNVKRGTAPFGGAGVDFFSSEGTVALPTGSIIGKPLSENVYYGYNGTGYVFTADMACWPLENWTVGKTGSMIEMYVTPIGTSAMATIETLRFDGSQINSRYTINNTTVSTSSLTGSLINKGGFGCSGDIFAGGSINSTTAIHTNLRTTAGSNMVLQLGANEITLNNTSTQSKLLVVQTGAVETLVSAAAQISLGKTESAGQSLLIRYFYNGTNYSTPNSGGNLTSYRLMMAGGTPINEFFQDGSAYFNNSKLQYNQGGKTGNDGLRITDTTTSTTTTTGALVVDGGAGIVGTMNVGGVLKLGTGGTNYAFPTARGSTQQSLVSDASGVLTFRSMSIGGMFVESNPTTTVVSATPGVFVKILGTTTASGQNLNFTHTNNRLTYTGTIACVFNIAYCCNIIPSTSTDVEWQVGIGANGSLTPELMGRTHVHSITNGHTYSASGTLIITLANSQFIDLLITNETNNTTNCIVEDFSVVCRQMSF